MNRSHESPSITPHAGAHVQPRTISDRALSAHQHSVESRRSSPASPGRRGGPCRADRTACIADKDELAARAACAGGGLARLDALRRHPAGEDAARHGTAGRSGEDHETTEPRA